jgi:hypothetical protein
MSTMTVTEAIAKKPRMISLTATKPIPQSTKTPPSDGHPLLVVLLAVLVSLGLSITMIGSILIWLSIRHSGVLAP